MAKVSSVHAEIRVETIAGYQEFPGLEPVWNEVAEAAGLDHPFLEHAWTRTWWECFGARRTLQILVLKAGDQPIAIAPLIRADFLIAQRPEGLDRPRRPIPRERLQLKNRQLAAKYLPTDVLSLKLRLLQ